jgi:hydroxymethylglutaryl-CoA lyase
MERVWITECPRDAMQGIGEFIPTKEKIRYLNRLLKVGFDRLDFGSFVSPKAIPQLRDTAEVLDQIELSGINTKLLAIVANMRGAEDAAQFEKVSILGFPFSVSETFQKRNTNSSISDSLVTVKNIRETCAKSGKELLVYISMAFGNPYRDPWNTDIVIGWIFELQKLGITKFALADTVGIAKESEIGELVTDVQQEFGEIELGIHLHCRPDNWKNKVDAAYLAGCRRFDSAIRGFGGCPMAKDELVGNLATEQLLQYLDEKNVETNVNFTRFKDAVSASAEVFFTH